MKQRFFNSSLSLEAVQFQDDRFFKELVLLFGAFKGQSSNDLRRNDSVEGIEAAVKKYTNLNIKLVIEHDGPMVEIPDIHRNSPLMSEFRRIFFENTDGIKMIKNAGAERARGSVNLKTGKVDGVFAEQKYSIYFPEALVAQKRFAGEVFTPEEMAGMMLHEVGHLFTFFEFINRSATTNQVLAGIARAYAEPLTAAEREAVLVRVKDTLRLEKFDPKEYSKVTDAKVMCLVVIDEEVDSTRSELGSNLYDSNNWEYLADQYAARYGGGRHVLTALAKLYRHGDIAFRSSGMYYFMEAVKVLGAIGFLASVGVAVATGQILAGILWVSMCWSVLTIDGVTDSEYDRPFVRLQRLRYQVVEAIKVKDNSPETIRSLNEDLVVIDKQLEYAQDRVGFFNVFLKTMSFTQTSKILRAEELQQQLESLVSNNLFASSASLRALANELA